MAGVSDQGMSNVEVREVVGSDLKGLCRLQ